jgi:SEC-C motif-containing protein
MPRAYEHRASAAKASGAMADDGGEVEFVARSRVGGHGQRLHERSRFRRVNGQRACVDGTFPGKRERLMNC